MKYILNINELKYHMFSGGLFYGTFYAFGSF